MKSNANKVAGTQPPHTKSTDKRILERKKTDTGLDISESKMSKEEFEQFFQKYQEQKL